METVKSRSESPFPKSKAKNQVLDAPENGEAEPVKPKKKRYNKQKLNGKENGDAEKNGKENGDAEKNGNDVCEEEKVVISAVESTEENVNVENENCNNGYGVNENGQGVKVEKEVKDAFNNVEEKVIETNGNGHDAQNEEEPISNMTIETESSAKKDIIEENDTLPEAENHNEENGEVNDNSESFHQNQETEECSPAEEPTSQTGLNGSDCEDMHTTNDHIQTSPDTSGRDENSFSNKISNFLSKWNYSSSQEDKQESEISSSKTKLNDSTTSEREFIPHPYLSKVTGRPGIRDRLNSTFTSTKDERMKTPTRTENPLNDSFRVRTNPPRLNSSDILENPTLRKYKGKRCLNAADDQEEEEDTNLTMNTIKRPKLDDNHETGLLGSILWSPFKKKPLENEKPTAESKLSRFLSPFWFWKKTAGGDNGK